MKNYKIVILIFAVTTSMLFNSCSDDFLDRFPTDQISAEDAVATTGNLRLVLNGIHRSLYIRYGAQGRTGIGSLMIQNEVLGEDFVMNARANGWFINAYQWNDHTNALDADDLFPYRTYYRIARNANTIINGVAVADGPDDEKNELRGQALIYRAWVHFQLVQLYGMRYDAAGNNTQLGVPIVLTTDFEPIARSTVEEVYQRINDDLDEAIVLLDGSGQGDVPDLDLSVAQGLKARVSLVQGNWAVAAQFAALARSGYTLADFDTYFNSFSDSGNGEWMWGSRVQEDQSDRFGNFGAWVSRNFSSSNIRGNPKSINSLLHATIPVTDVRSQLFDPTGDHLNLPPGVEISSRHQRFPYTNQKFIAAGTGDSRMDTPYMRAPEMYLIEAEARARMNDDAGAAAVLFELGSVRDPAYVLSVNTGQALIDEILLQRRWELWGEGFRFYDLKRLNLPLNRNGANHPANVAVIFDVPAGDPRWQWLIPQSALDANPLLEQNPL
ncbi:RagB/SusD family nutrient uptake outer membrane protein [Leptobacterium flavescens]|uniref:RagB/SusD family nutrient uptake outer membrane protein n=1 Tax=Leptobacterium flavescens TaxID=472055 RepID=A0A6P0UKH5_9FLAO|nr:RagB/SusD family nutrient uptake outer membrane protein [Leptobacterium flavescens]NER13871.1 RagB/SusD family nutrient uptake outer membrane protein [Leptobacterium flavescens]